MRFTRRVGERTAVAGKSQSRGGRGICDRTVLCRPPASDGRHAQGRRATGMVGFGSARACLSSRIISRFFFLFKWNILDATKGQTAAEFSAAFFFRVPENGHRRASCLLAILGVETRCQKASWQLALRWVPRSAGCQSGRPRGDRHFGFFWVHPKKVRLVRAATGSRFGVAVPKLSLWRQQFDVSRSPNGGSEHRVFE